MWLIFALLILLAAALLIFPLIKKKPHQQYNSGDINNELKENIAVFKDQEAESSQMLEQGFIDEAEYSDLISEYKYTLLANVKGQLKLKKNNKESGSWVLLVCLLLMPIFVFVTYSFLGASHDLHISNLLDKRTFNQMSDLDRIKLNKKIQMEIYESLTDDPTQINYLIALAQLKMENKNFFGAKETYLKALNYKPNDPKLLSEYAQAIYFSENRRFTKDLNEILDKTLKLNPNNSLDLGLNGIKQFEQGRYKLAVLSWKNALKTIAGNSKEADALNSSILYAEKYISVNDFKIPIEITIPEVYKIDKDKVIYIYAREWQGITKPLAAVKFKLSELPEIVFLDDSMSMSDGRSLSSIEFLEIIARVSISGEVTPLPGDYQGTTGKFNFKEQKKAKININNKL